MILLADSGSTKTDWCAVADGKAIASVKTAGMNPFQQSAEDIERTISEELMPHLPARHFAEVHFYGAGCTKEKAPIVEAALRRLLTIDGEAEVVSDMLGAARAVCGHHAGIACILGTGSNSCAYDGEQIIKNVSPLGYILGDEGSGAVMGKYLIGDILKHQMPDEIICRFNEKYHLTSAEIIDRVYRQPMPNRFLASFMPFIEENIGEQHIHNLVLTQFRSFLRRNVRQYEGFDRLPIGFNGSIAKIYRSQLEQALHEEGMTLGRIVQAPMEGMIAYHNGEI